MSTSKNSLSRLVLWSVNHPRKVYGLVATLCLISLMAFPFARVDTNPKNMLPLDSEIRSLNQRVDETFDLHEDLIVVGVTHTENILNQNSLKSIQRITSSIKALPGVVSRDVTSITTVDNIEATADGGIEIKPLVDGENFSTNKIETALFESDLFVDRLISRDKKTSVIYIPLEQGTNAKKIADNIREITTSSEHKDLTFYIAGDPVARDTFGAEMFKLMAIFSPIAGAIMCLALFLMFRSVTLIVAMMVVAMSSIIISMGSMIALGFPIHIMSSMAPVFLMAIATDSIHIFNEYRFRIRETGDKHKAVLETMAEVARPVQYTALATAAGFAVLMFMEIVPVKVFGGLIVFGTIVLRFLSFSLIPAILIRLPEKTLLNSDTQEPESKFLASIAGIATRRPWLIVSTLLILLGVSVAGMSKIHINNNQLEWFLPSSDIRVADDFLNTALGGTAPGYFIVQTQEPEGIKTPEIMNYIDKLQGFIEGQPGVGNTFSVANYVKRMHQVLNGNRTEFHTIPESSEIISQYLFLFGMSARPSDLNNVVDYPFQTANIYVQLTTWDVAAMAQVTAAVKVYQQENPSELIVTPAGTAQFNVVWNHEVLLDMVWGFAFALVAVFILLSINFGSWRWALVGYLPLLFTIVLIYGVVGWIGKDFDMPISVLSCLSLGMAVDFSIHFISRFRQKLASSNAEDIKATLIWAAGRPGKGIMRNALLFAAAFSVMILAPLTPYITVGVFILSMMMLSALATMLFIPAFIFLARNWLFKFESKSSPEIGLKGSV